MDPSRRGLFFGRVRPVKQGLRPPGALPETAFLDACTRCDACSQACPSRIIVPAEGRFPEMDFARGECTFCGECQKACQTGALSGTAARWQASIQTAKCLAHQGVECRICGENCEAGALVFKPRIGGAAHPELILPQCTGCGACVASCPNQAIAIKELP